MTPRTGCTVGTIGHYWPPKAAIVTGGIQTAQRFGRWPGIPRIPSPYWKITHSMGYVGALDPLMVRAAVEAGTITAEKASELLAHNDWMLSMTTPVGIWTRYADVRGRHFISRPTFCDCSEEWQRRAFEAACWWWIGRKYDIGQLFGILADLLGEPKPKEYSRLLDASPWRTVCSGAVASAYEAVRRTAIAAHHGGASPQWITAEYGEWPDEGGPTWWPRILHALHLERTACGHLCLPPWFETEEVAA